MRLRDLNIAHLLPPDISLDQEVGESRALLYACETGNKNLAAILLKNGADANRDNVLLTACNLGALDIVELLLNNGADPNRDPRVFTVGVEHGGEERRLRVQPLLQELLLKHGLDITARIAETRSGPTMYGGAMGESYTMTLNNTVFEQVCVSLGALIFPSPGYTGVGTLSAHGTSTWDAATKAAQAEFRAKYGRDFQYGAMAGGPVNTMNIPYTPAASDYQLNLMRLYPTQYGTQAVLLNAVHGLLSEGRREELEGQFSHSGKQQAEGITREARDITNIIAGYENLSLRGISEILGNLPPHQQAQFQAYCLRASELVSEERQLQAVRKLLASVPKNEIDTLLSRHAGQHAEMDEKRNRAGGAITYARDVHAAAAAAAAAGSSSSTPRRQDTAAGAGEKDERDRKHTRG